PRPRSSYAPDASRHGAKEAISMSSNTDSGASAGGPGESPAVPIHLRPARDADVPALVPLLLRLKRLNEEFDPLLKVRDDADQQARQILKADIANPKAV